MARAGTVIGRILTGAGGLLALLVVLGAAGALWLRHQVTASLPLLDGEIALADLSAPVRIQRDALGVPAISGASRADVARATGFVHGQDRFFQMDLMRREAAGELAELIGPALLPRDRENRIHRFRDLSRRVLEGSSPVDRALVEAYAAGVNAGLASLGARPFEYVAFRSDPAPWLPEDSALVALSMFLSLHDDRGRRESTLGLMRDVLPSAMFEFLATRGTEWDAPVIGTPLTMPEIPGPEVLDLRLVARTTASSGSRPERRRLEADPEPFAGSNNWAVSGAHTADGGALLANDMHLGLMVPNTWYRASLSWPGPNAPGGAWRVTGVTLPGAPAIVVGSNGRVAWGFTNSYGDWVDLILLDVDPREPESYLTPDGPRRLEHHPETIHVRGAPDETLDVATTIWGPVLDRDHRGRARALRWTAHYKEAVDFEILHFETSAGLDDALDRAARAGAPPQNFVAADATGRIGWTIMGAIPRRLSVESRLPLPGADATSRWDGWLAPEEYPRIVDPVAGRIWTANARVVDGDMLRMVGDGGYDLGARAGQIRDDILALEKATPRDMLDVQLDDRALYLRRWHDLLLAALTPEAIAADPRRGEMRRFVESWGARASVDSVGFRMVRGFRSFLSQQILDAVTTTCRQADPNFRYGRISQSEGPLWKLITERPVHLLDPKFKSWDEQILAGADAALDYFLSEGFTLARRTWGQRNTISIRHPLSLAVPLVGRWLDMPAEQLPGDSSDMPRVQSPSEGASERMAVSPGREAEGYFHMPCGQSGHPMSPHYGDGQAAWARGEPTPFLPGPPRHTLTLVPKAGR
jgi:penicillin amidase